jgi:hypothetical protein
MTQDIGAMLVELVMRHRDADLMQGNRPAQKVDIVLVLRRIELDHLSKKRQGGSLDAHGPVPRRPGSGAETEDRFVARIMMLEAPEQIVEDAQR